MTNVTAGMRFEVSHKAATPEDPSLVGADDIAAYMLIDSVAISTATSKAVSTVGAAAPDSSNLSIADSKGVSAGGRASVADSKSVSNSVNISVADSKAVSVSGSTSIADSKAVSVANSVPILTVVAASQTVSVADSKAVSLATNVTPPPADGRTVTTVATYLDNNKTLNVRDFSSGLNISAGTLSARPAFLAAIAEAVLLGYKRIRVPDGTYLLPSEVAVPAGIELVGDSMAGTIILHRPTADGICFKVSASAAVAYYGAIRNLSIYSDDLTYTKVAIELNDVSSFRVQRVNIYGTGTGTPTANYYTGGTGSIGIRTKGREATGLRDLKIVADYPIYIDANPNTARTDGEDIDHWHGENFYLVANGHYNITVAAGVGIISLTLDGYQAWVGGTGGFFMNDTRVAPTIPSRHLSFSNVRGEQCQDANGYWFNITSAFPIQTLAIRNALGASTGQGIKVDGCLQLLLDNVTMATAVGKNSLLVQGATGGSVISMRGCYWQPSSVVTLTGYTATAIEAYNSALVASPGTATYVNTAIGDTLVNVGKLTANVTAATVGLLVQATSSGDNLQVLPQAAGSGASVRANNSAQTDFTPLSFVASTLDFRYRTGVATSASAASVDTNGTLLTGKVQTTVTAATTAYLALGAAGGDGLQILPNAAASGASIRAVNNTVADFTPLVLIGSTLDVRNRTGVATSASALQMDASGNVIAQNDLKVGIVGKGLYVKEGANATMGLAVLVAGTLVVSTTKVTANSRIFLTHQNASGVAGFLVVSARSAGVSFTILSSNASDTSSIAWWIVEPA